MIILTIYLAENSYARSARTPRFKHNIAICNILLAFGFLFCWANIIIIYQLSPFFICLLLGINGYIYTFFNKIPNNSKGARSCRNCVSIMIKLIYARSARASPFILIVIMYIGAAILTDASRAAAFCRRCESKGYVPNSFLIRFLSMKLRLMCAPTPHELFLFHDKCCSHSDMCFPQNFTAFSVHPSAPVPMPSPKP